MPENLPVCPFWAKSIVWTCFAWALLKILLFSVCVCVVLYCYFCHPCFMCTLATQMNECAIGPSQLGWPFETAMRTKLRAMYGIRVSLCDFYAHAEAHALTLRVDWRWITVNKISKNYLSIVISSQGAPTFANTRNISVKEILLCGFGCMIHLCH